MVRMRLKCGGSELFDHPSDRIAIRAHAALFDHHIAFFIKLAHYRLRETRRFKIGPKLQPIGGQRIEIIGFVVIGAGVDVLASVALKNFGELLGDDVFLRLGNRILPGFLQLLQFLFVAANSDVALSDVGSVSSLDFGERNFLGRIIGGADCIRSLEGHVLEHVGKAGFAERILRRTGVHMGIKRKNWSFGALADQNRQAVMKFLDCDPLLERSDVLRSRDRTENEDSQQITQATEFHSTSTRLDAYKRQKFEVTRRRGKLSNARPSEQLQSGIKERL